MKYSNTLRVRTPILMVGLAVAALGANSCSTSESPAQAVGSDSVVVAPLAPMVSGTNAPSTVAPTTALATTTTTVPETTTTIPATTTTTTVPETTTTLPPEPTTTLAPNEELIGAFPTPIPAIGKSSGPNTQVVQLRLLQLGFWLSGPDGDYGITTRQAVMAFQKYVGLPADGSVTNDTAAYLTNLAIKGHGYSDAGTLVEVDKGRQLLFFVVDGKPLWVLNTSTATGKEYEEEDKNTPGEVIKGVSITPDGLWKVNRERPEGWWEGDLGQIYRPKYFRGGVAVHGSNSIPNYPASHGCVRLSVPAMDMVWEANLMPIGTTVWVHE